MEHIASELASIKRFTRCLFEQVSYNVGGTQTVMFNPPVQLSRCSGLRKTNKSGGPNDLNFEINFLDTSVSWYFRTRESRDSEFDRLVEM